MPAAPPEPRTERDDGVSGGQAAFRPEIALYGAPARLGTSRVASRSITSSSERHVVTTPPARVAIHVAQSGADMSIGGCNR